MKRGEIKMQENRTVELLEKIHEALKIKDAIDFPKGSVPVETVAKVYGKDATWVRAGIIAGWLPIGYATRNGERVTDVNDMNSKLGKISYVILPKKLYEDTGYVWKGKGA